MIRKDVDYSIPLYYIEPVDNFNMGLCWGFLFDCSLQFETDGRAIPGQLYRRLAYVGRRKNLLLDDGSLRRLFVLLIDLGFLRLFLNLWLGQFARQALFFFFYFLLGLVFRLRVRLKARAEFLTSC